MTDAEPIARLEATELLERFRSGELSPVEVVEAAFEVVEKTAGLNSFTTLDVDGARRLAGASEARWRNGEPAGHLDGVPVAIKDVFLTRGLATLRGSRLIDPIGPWDDDSPVAAAVRRHGAIIIGKTTTPEFGWKGVTDSPLHGVTRNPWNADLTPGGSSGGSAVAVASGAAPLAVGTDGGGSIRIPCAFCGIPGLKPTHGRVPLWPPSPFGPLAHAGPMARSVHDLALGLDVLAESDPRDWGALEPPRESFSVGLDSGVAGLRMAFTADLGYADVDPEVGAIVAQAAAAFADLGATVENREPGFRDPRYAFDVLWSAGAALVVDRFRGEADLSEADPGLIEIARHGSVRSGVAVVRAFELRDHLATAMSRFHEDWDLLLTPTVAVPPFAAGLEAPPDSRDGRWPSWTPFTYPFNLTQQPAGTVPCGFTNAGLPVGLQIVGRRYADALVLRAMRAYEAAHPQATFVPFKDHERVA